MTPSQTPTFLNLSEKDYISPTITRDFALVAAACDAFFARRQISFPSMKNQIQAECKERLALRKNPEQR